MILRDSLRSLYFSVCLTLLFSFSATWWKFSTDADAYIPSVLFLLLSFYLILPGKRLRPFLVAFTFFVSMCFHQLAIVSYPVLALGLYLQDDSLPGNRRIRNTAYFTVTAFVLITATYSFCFYLATGSFSIPRLARWTASYSTDASFTFNIWSNLVYALRGQVRLFFGGRFNLLKGITNPLVWTLMISLAGIVLLLFLEALRSLRRVSFQSLHQLRLDPTQKTLLLLSTLWVTVYLVFLFVWLPQNTFYRLFYLPGLILLVGLGLSALEKTTSHQRRFRTALVVSAVMLANFLFLIYPFSHAEKYPPLAFALELNRQWSPGTVVYYDVQNSDERLVRCFTPSTSWKLLERISSESLDSELDAIYAKGGTVWLDTTAIDRFASTPEGARWLEMRARKEGLRVLKDPAYKIQFVQVVPEK